MQLRSEQEVDRDELLNDSETAMRVALDGRQAQMWTAMPAMVTKVNLTAMTLEVQPTIQGVISNSDGTETNVNLPVLVDVPICFPSAGGFTLTFPIVVNDEVLVIIASRCIDSWWQSGGVGVPIESRMHDLSDGFAILGPKSQPHVITGISTTSAQLRNDSGTTFLGPTAAGKIEFENATKTLKGVLNGMLGLLSSLESALSSFAATASTDPIATVVAGAATTLSTQLTILSTQITLYETTDIGALLE